MSAKQTGLVWELALPHNEAWVLMAMADHADHEGNNVYPGVPLLAWKTGYTTRQVRRILATLQEKGLIVVEEEGGGRKTTHYRLELSRAARKDSRRPQHARSRQAEPTQSLRPREDKMSPLDSAPEAQMSPLPGLNVRAARTQLCHPNRQGREVIEPSIPPPSDSSLHPQDALVGGRPPDGENGEGGKRLLEDRRGISDGHPTVESSTDVLWLSWTRWVGRQKLPPARRRAFELQAKALASGEDLEAWTHPQNGVIVPSSDRLRLFNLGLQHLQDMTSRTLRGGVMYAVAKCYRTPPPIQGTEYAAVVARGSAGEYPGRSRSRAANESKTLMAAATILQPPSQPGHPADYDPVDSWEREYPDESVKLRDEVLRQIAAEVHGRRVSEQTLQLAGRAQYRHLVLRRIAERKTTVASAIPSVQDEVRSGPR